MQAAREKRKTSTTEGTEGTEDDGQECATKPIPGGTTEELDHGRHGRHGRKRTGIRDARGSRFRGRMGRVERGKERRRTGRLTTDGTEGGGPRDEAGGGSREGGIGGRAGEGRTIPGRKRTTARGAVGGSEEGRGGEKKAASEANLEMIKQLMAQRFSDMPAARGRTERSQLAGGCRSGPGGECDGSMAGESAGGVAG